MNLNTPPEAHNETRNAYVTLQGPALEAPLRHDGVTAPIFRMALLAVRRTLAGAQTKAFLGSPTVSR